MPDMSNLDKKFNECCFTLSQEDISEFDKKDNGAITNVIAGIDDHCFGVRLCESHLGLAADMFYINGYQGLRGDIINLNDTDYFALLLRFCALLSENYRDLDALDAFNTFQKKLRVFLEKLGFFTTTNLELKKFAGQNVTMMSLSHKGIFKLEFIEKTEYYRSFFGGIFKTDPITGKEYVYLMVNTDTSLIKIGTSKNPVYREGTLHSKEPSIHLIAIWEGDKRVERMLHNKFQTKRVRGEWFRLTLSDLAALEAVMNNL